MKRLLCMMLALITILIFCGCTTDDPVNSADVSFYYIKTELEFSSDTPVLVRLARNIDLPEGNYGEIIRIYLNGPTTYDCVSPFPGGTELVDWHIDGERAYVILSPHMGTLTSVEQTVASACLARTVFELTHADSVQIKVNGGLICGKESISFHADSFAFFDSMTPEDAAK